MILIDTVSHCLICFTYLIIQYHSLGSTQGCALIVAAQAEQRSVVTDGVAQEKAANKAAEKSLFPPT